MTFNCRVISRKTITALVALAFCVLSSLSCAEPLIDAGDEKTRHHLQVLADAGVIELSPTTWPLSWSNVSYALSQVELEDLDENLRWSYRYLRHALSQAKKNVRFKFIAHAASAPQVISDFSSEAREAVFAEFEVSQMRGRFFSNFNATAVAEPSDEQRYRLDGSYAAFTWGNWILGAGAVDRWWGPGWQGSLAMSDNARPSPGFFLSRKNSLAPEWKYLSWLGPWDLTLFANQLEEDRYVSKAKLLGGRLTLRPHHQVELGLNRMAQWGGTLPNGEKRIQSLSSLVDLVLGRDNVGEYGTTFENEPGNQIAGYDWRISHSLWNTQFALYHQRIGEDEKDYWIFQEAHLWGLESSRLLWGVHSRFVFEFIDTINGNNNIYEHGIYRSGYRYQGRPIGASIDSSSRTVSVLGEHFFDNGHQLSWRYSNMDINLSEKERQPPAGNVFGDEHIPVKYFSLGYKMPLNSWLLLEGNAFHYDQSFEFSGQTLESGAYLRLYARF